MSAPAARLLPVPRDGLPGLCDAFLEPAGEGEFFASRLWYDTLLAHALPPGAEPLVALCGPDQAMLLPLLREGGRLSALVSPYSLDWRPLALRGAGPEALRTAGRAFGTLLRWRPPLRLELLDPEATGLDAVLAGLAQARLRPLRFLHTGNWHEALPPGTGWAGYLAGRPSTLRSTITRKLARAARETDFALLAVPGPALEQGIAAYVQVRAASWKPDEPFPDFDAALMRAAAAKGLLRLGVLRSRADGQPLAAQYWILDRGLRRATVLKLSYVEASRSASPGTALTALVIRHLLETDGVTELDFGRGDDDYKQGWVGQRRQRVGFLVADPFHPAGAMAVARRFVAGFRQAR